jgi:hypothetical protein
MRPSLRLGSSTRRLRAPTTSRPAALKGPRGIRRGAVRLDVRVRHAWGAGNGSRTRRAHEQLREVAGCPRDRRQDPCPNALGRAIAGNEPCGVRQRCAVRAWRWAGCGSCCIMSHSSIHGAPQTKTWRAASSARRCWCPPASNRQAPGPCKCASLPHALQRFLHHAAAVPSPASSRG